MNFTGLKILVAGDVMLDQYISGTASRMSPEAPVPIVQKKSAWSVPGGAANVARGLVRLGCQPTLVGLIGKDVRGEILRTQVASEGIRESLIVSGFRPTTCKTRILAQGQQLLRVDEENCRAPELEEEVCLRKYAGEYADQVKAIILSDYAKGALHSDNLGNNLCSYLIDRGRKERIPVLVDPKGTDWDRYKGATCVTPNVREFLQVCQAIGIWREDTEPGALVRQKLAGELCARFDLGYILLTRGARGMTLYRPGEEPENIRAVMREVADVSGAGDTVIATLAACIASGMPWAEAAGIANAAAGVAVTKLGASPVGLAELTSVPVQTSALIANRTELEEKVRLWRDAGQKIVFTNGCFDLLHPGHISLLAQCAGMGDRLVVGLNTDASVKGLKGSKRPVQDEKSRAEVLGALKYVDAVVLFDEPTPEDLIRLVHPDILVKGADYKIEDVAGAEFVKSYGGQVRLAELVGGCSTTDLISRIKGGK